MVVRCDIVETITNAINYEMNESTGKTSDRKTIKFIDNCDIMCVSTIVDREKKCFRPYKKKILCKALISYGYDIIPY